MWADASSLCSSARAQVQLECAALVGSGVSVGLIGACGSSTTRVRAVGAQSLAGCAGGEALGVCWWVGRGGGGRLDDKSARQSELSWAAGLHHDVGGAAAAGAARSPGAW